jgi:hypothetical protein
VIEVKLVLCTTEDAAAFVALEHDLLHPGRNDSLEIVHAVPLHYVIGRVGQAHTKPEGPAGAHVSVFVTDELEKTSI